MGKNYIWIILEMNYLGDHMIGGHKVFILQKIGEKKQRYLKSLQLLLIMMGIKAMQHKLDQMLHYAEKRLERKKYGTINEN